MPFSKTSRRRFCQTLGSVLAASVCASGAQAAPVTLRFAASNAYAPFSYLDSNGTLQGLVVESLKLIGEEAGCAIDFRGVPWARVQQLLKSGGLDACCAQPTDDRRAYLDFVELPVISDQAGIVHRADNPHISPNMSLKQLADLRIGTFLGATWTNELLPGQQMIVTGNQDAVVNMIAFNRLDAYVESEIVALHKIEMNAFPGTLAFTPIEAFPSATYCFGLRRDFPDGKPLLAKIGEAVRALHASGELQKVRAEFSL